MHLNNYGKTVGRPDSSGELTALHILYTWWGGVGCSFSKTSTSLSAFWVLGFVKPSVIISCVHHWTSAAVTLKT